MISPQQSLFPDLYPEMTAPGPVNVSTVPQRSPFRYPGGKTWFVPTFRSWVLNLQSKPMTLVEPFVGGGIISLTALFEDMVQKAVMVELDEDVAAVWKTVVHGDAKWLANRILKFNLTRESVIEEISNSEVETKEKAFQTILKNRTNHGGILASGAGLLKHGENGKGIRSRWYPETLAKRFLDLDTIADRIHFCQVDGLDIMQEYANQKDVIFFIDPPYTAGGKKAGSRLYRHCNLDHDRLFSVCEQLSGDFLMTYDNADEVKLLARKHGFQMRLISMNNTHHATMEELVIGKDLTWMDQYTSVHEPREDYLAVQ